MSSWRARLEPFGSCVWKNPIVDLLHVYDADHKARLQHDVHADWHMLLGETQSTIPDSVHFAADTPAGPGIAREPGADDLPAETDSDVVDVDDI